MEKRHSKRYLKVLSVRFGTREYNHVGLTHDLSDNGILLKSNRIFSPLTKLTLELSIAPQMKVYCEGYVQWAKQPPPSLVRIIKNVGMGILLVNTPLEYNQFIYELGYYKERRSSPRPSFSNDMEEQRLQIKKHPLETVQL